MPKKTPTTEREMAGNTPPASGRDGMMPVVFVLVVLLLCSLGVAGYFYYQYRHIGNPASETDERDRLTQEIGLVMELPGDEVPTLATVTDRGKLADQPFFQKAQNGDKVLIYTNSGRAILYRPSVHSGEKGKIVDVTTINTSVSSVEPEPSVTPPTDTSAMGMEAPKTEATTETEPATAKIALYNGTTRKGLTQKYEGEIMKEYSSATIVAKESASKSDYEQTLVIDLTGKQTDFAKKLATTYGVTVTPLPTGENAPADADILVIYGADRL